MKRRDFVKLGTALTAMPALAKPNQQSIVRYAGNSSKIDFIHDGLDLSAKEYAELLLQLADEGKIKPDYYSNGGVVEELEYKFATLLGQESAVFMPTGTLANHIAVRRLSGLAPRTLVQEQSHLYNDSGDCAQILSGLHLIPLGEGKVEYTVAEMETAIARSTSGRVATSIGALAIESPVRRKQDRMVSYETMKAITSLAQNHRIKTHLDGARIFVQAAHTNISTEQYGKLFDTVYTSLWKCFNASSGAILAGSKSLTENLFHERRMFGGSLPCAWAFAAIALHYADRFIPDYLAASSRAKTLFAALVKNEQFKITAFDNGSHIVKFDVIKADPNKFSSALLKRNIQLPPPTENRFLLKINPSLHKISTQDVAGYFLEALKVAG